MDRLALRVDAIAGECATSLASRLGVANGEDRLRSFCTHMGLPIKQLRLGDAGCLLRLSQLADVELDALSAWTPKQNEAGYFDLGAERIKFSAFTRTSMRMCPTCVAEQGVHQKGIWQLSQIRVCPDHRCLLQDLPRPALADDQLDVMTCARGVECGATAPVDLKSLGLQTYLIDRLQGRGTGGWLDEFPFHVVALSCEAFGLLLTQGARAVRANTTDLEWVYAGQAGFDVMRRGPQAFTDKLQAIEDANPTLSIAYRSRFWVFFEWLRDRRDDPAFDPIRDIMRDFIFRTYPVAAGAQVLGQRNPRRQVYDYKSMAKELRLNRVSLNKELIRLGIAEGSFDKGTVYKQTRLVRAQEAEAIRQNLRRLLTATAAANKLGITRVLLGELVEDGLIWPYFPKSPHPPVYHRRHTFVFYHHLTRNWQPYADTRDPIPLTTAAKTAGIPLREVIKQIYVHGLTITKRKEDPPGIAGLFIGAKVWSEHLAQWKAH